MYGYVILVCPKKDIEDMYFRLGFSHRFTSPILLYIVGKMTGIDFSCSDIQWTPKE